MLIAIDIGNSVTDIGVFVGRELTRRVKTESDINKGVAEIRHFLKVMLEEYQLSRDAIESAIISSVVPLLTPVWEKAVYEELEVRPTFVSTAEKAALPISSEIDASDLGADIIAASVAALSKYGICTVVADLGTANKLIYLNEKGEFAGLSIAPGLRIAAKSLRNGTSALPEIPLEKVDKAIGKNTKDCILSGVVYGAATSIKGLALAFEKEAGFPLKWILTGGNAQYVADLLPEFKLDESLVLDGLSLIASKN
ncbi:MAG: type III pantothenate kinase [Candidatus Enteromonas sp.]|jgi:type III pantothenate kinase|nr:type III pantothenate kinase [Bacilli bacterium]MEE3432074.1 type III pantothenate kinase [Candidatus Enteromonas sp.]MEE3442930.1 type III pantothenate kinase [Candidatus Enteromonas sp.]MEE3464867.1 type III pantothenate kinase [Candidatus Enteromonas sp.]